MAALGTIGVKALLTKASPKIGQAGWDILRCIVCGPNYEVVGMKDPIEGILRMDARGMWRFRWLVLNGNRSVQVDVKQVVNLSPRPTMVIKANAAIGVNADITTTAGSSTGYITIGPTTINPSSIGAVWVELHNNYDGQYLSTPCFWKNVVMT